MTWERQLLAVLDDLEQQAEGLALAERDAAVEELSRAEYAAVDLASRLHASVGLGIELDVLGAGRVRGRLIRVGAGWCLLDQAPVGQQCLLSQTAVVAVRGLAAGARLEATRQLTARLGVGSVLRTIGESRETVAVVRVDGMRVRGRVGRVGADFFELAAEPAAAGSALDLVPFAALALLGRD